MATTGKKKRPHNICLTDEMWDRIEAVAKKHDVSAGQVVRQALDSFLKTCEFGDRKE